MYFLDIPHLQLVPVCVTAIIHYTTPPVQLDIDQTHAQVELFRDATDTAHDTCIFALECSGTQIIFTVHMLECVYKLRRLAHAFPAEKYLSKLIRPRA